MSTDWIFTYVHAECKVVFGSFFELMFFMQYFDIFYLLPNTSQTSLLLSYTHNFIFFLLPSSPNLFWKSKQISRLFKKETNKTKKYKNKLKKKHGVHFVLASYSCASGLLWSVVDIPGDTSLEKSYFPFPSRHQLYSLLGRGGTLCPPPLLGAGIVWLGAVHVLS